MPHATILWSSLLSRRACPPRTRPAGAPAKRGMFAIGSIGALAILLTCAIARADDAPKPKVAVFPLAGTAPAAQREQVGFSIRSKLDRDGHYEPIDGPTMDDLSHGNRPALSAKPAELAAMAVDEAPAILIWGEVDGDVNTAGGATLHLKLLDTRDKGAVPQLVDQPLKHPTDLRFAVEKVVGSIKGVGPFAHPVENAVTDDPAAAALWKSNPNLMVDGDFAKAGHWAALLRGSVYPAPVRDALPDTDQVEILRRSDGHGGLTNVLAMTLSRGVAESNGLACLSAPVPIHPGGRYRIQFRYRSDGPTLHVFVKGYTPGKDIAGGAADVESYRLQVPPSGPTDNKWKTVVADLNPQNPIGPPPATLRVDLYAYLGAGTVMFADVQLRDVGQATRRAVDDALRNKVPTTRP
jgi:hypothetical protein